jgi:hypothetical protein
MFHTPRKNTNRIIQKSSGKFLLIVIHWEMRHAITFRVWEIVWGLYYGLDLKYPLKVHVLKSPDCGNIGKWYNLQEVGPSKRKLGHWSHILVRILGSQPLLVSLCFPGPHDTSLPHSTEMMHCATIVPKQQSQMTMDWSFWNHEPKQTFPPLSAYLRYFVTATESWHSLSADSENPPSPS